MLVLAAFPTKKASSISCALLFRPLLCVIVMMIILAVINSVAHCYRYIKYVK